MKNLDYLKKAEMAVNSVNKNVVKNIGNSKEKSMKKINSKKTTKKAAKTVNTNTGKKTRKNARVGDDVKLYRTQALLDREPVRKLTPNRNSKDNPYRKNWGRNPEIIAQRKKAFAQYQADFDKRTYRQFSLKMNAFTEADICWILDHSKEGVKQFVLRLIKEEMERNPKKYPVPKKVQKAALDAKREKGYIR